MSTPTIPVRVSRFGAFIRQVRKERNITLSELALKAGVSKGNLSKIENGGDPQLTTVVRLCDALNVSVNFTDNAPIKRPLPL